MTANDGTDNFGPPDVATRVWSLAELRHDLIRYRTASEHADRIEVQARESRAADEVHHFLLWLAEENLSSTRSPRTASRARRRRTVLVGGDGTRRAGQTTETGEQGELSEPGPRRKYFFRYFGDDEDGEDFTVETDLDGNITGYTGGLVRDEHISRLLSSFSIAMNYEVEEMR